MLTLPLHNETVYLDFMFLSILLLFLRRMTTSSDSSLPSCVICWCWRPRQRRKPRKHTGLFSFCKLHREHRMKVTLHFATCDTAHTKNAWMSCQEIGQTSFETDLHRKAHRSARTTQQTNLDPCAPLESHLLWFACNPPSGRAPSVQQAAVSERATRCKLRPIARGLIADCSVVGKTLQAKQSLFPLACLFQFLSSLVGCFIF